MSRSENKKLRYTSARELAEKSGSSVGAAYLRIPDKVQLFKPKAGIYLLDIIPYRVTGKTNPNAEAGCVHWERTFFSHRGIGPNADAVLCMRKTANKPCPICEYKQKLQRAARDEDEQLIKDLASKQRQLFNVRNLKDPDKGIQVWDVSNFLFGQKLLSRVNDSEEEDQWENFFYLDGGLTLKISFQEKSFNGTTFFEASSIDFKPRKEPYDLDILDEAHCLDDMLITPDYDKLKKELLEIEDEDDEKPRSKKKSSNDADEDDSDEEDTDGDDDGDEDESPKSKRKAPKDDDEDDKWNEFDEDDDSDEEEEDEPKKKGKNPKSKDDDEESEDEEDTDGDDDGDEDESPKSKRKSSDDEEEDTDGDDDGDEDEEEKPRGKKKSSREDDDEEEDDPEPDEEDEEEEKPRVRSGARDDDDEDEERPKSKKRR